MKSKLLRGYRIEDLQLIYIPDYLINNLTFME